ncbi:MAG: orotidine 5'-phosphate decarboxylase [delta proteobacterium MLS_D]|jgi:orotidine-5'-phosphate decarboxylase|nr:MAG: orotidine 5'-phosphate decarboxylase [delta proteobacterium MLS_D]
MKSNKTAKERLIFALDVGDDLDEALALVDLLKDHVGMFKIGKEAFTRFGPAIVEAVAGHGTRVFLDLKFHDIPNTVARATEAALKMPVSMLTIHATGGTAMMREAAAAARRSPSEGTNETPLILAVTVLTSLGDDDVASLGFSLKAKDLVPRLALMAREAGVHGVVASPGDIRAIKQTCGDDFVVVTPGIRRVDDITGDDQKRTLTAEEAAAAGADYLVVGRPIRTAPDPVAAARRITDEISKGLAGRTGVH